MLSSTNIQIYADKDHHWLFIVKKCWKQFPNTENEFQLLWVFDRNPIWRKGLGFYETTDTFGKMRKKSKETEEKRRLKEKKKESCRRNKRSVEYSNHSRRNRIWKFDGKRKFSRQFPEFFLSPKWRTKKKATNLFSAKGKKFLHFSLKWWAHCFFVFFISLIFFVVIFLTSFSLHLFSPFDELQKFS